MQRKLIITDDGSSSIYVEKLGEHYHSHFGARQESEHIFINSALKQLNKSEINILEYGFGTGLNALLSLEYAMINGVKINYTSIEKYPVISEEYSKLNFGEKDDLFIKLHETEWGIDNVINDNFSLQKINSDFREFNSKSIKFDVVFFDAFAPDVQPHLWSEEIFAFIYNSMNIGGVLTTYTVKGSVRRLLKSVGFDVEKIPGPPGKREITRAWKK